MIRRSIRLKEYDYTAPGFYFVTICAHKRQKLFGKIQNGELISNQFGKIVEEEWIKSSVIRQELIVHDWILMPNHFHGIIEIKSSDPCRGDRPVAPTGPKSKSIGAFIAGFKAAVTAKINSIQQTPGCQIWQRNYYEHVIRDEPELSRIKEYIQLNPMQWEQDRFFQE